MAPKLFCLSTLLLLALASAQDKFQDITVCKMHYREDTFLKDGKDIGSKTADECRDACNSDTQCVAADRSIASGTCYTHTGRQPTHTKKTQHEAWIKICQGCAAYEWRGVLINDGKFDGTKNRDQCRDDCIKDDPNCFAADHNSDNNECWVHRPPVPSPYINAAKWTSWVLQCPCKVQYEMYNNTGAIDGEQQSDLGSLQSCLDQCSNLAPDVCGSIDWNKDDQTCFFFRTNEAYKYENGPVTHYAKKECPEEPGCNIIKEENYKVAQGGNPQPLTGVTTEEACQQACLNNVLCHSTQWDKNAKTCQLFENVPIRTEKDDCCNRFMKYCNAAVQTTVTGTGCVDSFMEEKNKGAAGGDLQKGITKVEGCRQKCGATKNCTAFDFVFDNDIMDKCWFHYKEDLRLYSPEQANSVSHFSKVDCVTTARISSTTPKIVMTTASPQQAACRMVTSVNAQGFGGIPVGTRRDSVACGEECLSNPTCESADYDKEQRMCYIFTKESPLFDNNCCNHLVKKCDIAAVCRVTPTADSRIRSFSGGVVDTTASSEAACSKKCLDNVDCMSADWNKNTKQCYIYTTASTDFETNSCCVRLAKEGAPCTGKKAMPLSGACSLTTYAKTHGFAGTERLGILDEAECKLACITDITCRSVDWDKTLKKCFFFSTIVGRVENDCCSHYEKDCLGCSINVLTSTSDDNGDLQKTVKTAQGCQQACLMNTKCIESDYNKNTNECWLHYSTPTRIPNSPCCEVYLKSCKGCVDEMVVRQDFHGFDGKPMANISSLGECQDHCLSRSDCHSIDYVVAAQARPPFCFWFDDKYVNVYEARGVNHYTRKDCIPSTTVAPVVTTAAPLKEEMFAVGVGVCESTVATGSDPIKFKDIYADYNGHYEYGSGYIPIPDTAYYYWSITAGVLEGQTAEMGYSTNENAYANFPGIYRKSTSHNGLDTMSREWASRFEEDKKFGARAITALQSYDNDQVTLSMFNIEHVSKPMVFFTATRSSSIFKQTADTDVAFTSYHPYAGPLPSTNGYTCREEGVYYFNFGAGLESGRKLSIWLRYGNTNYQLVRQHTKHNDVDSMSRSAMISCSRNSIVRLVIQGNVDNVYGSTQTPITWTAVRYEPGHGEKIAWSVSRSSQGSSIDSNAAISFSRVDVNEGDGFKSNMNAFVAPKGGYYWVSFSAGAMAGQQLRINLTRKLARNGITQVFVDLLRESTTHDNIDTLSRSMLVSLEEGDQLYLAAVNGTSFYSDTNNILSFMGFLVAPNKEWD